MPEKVLKLTPAKNMRLFQNLGFCINLVCRYRSTAQHIENEESGRSACHGIPSFPPSSPSSPPRTFVQSEGRISRAFPSNAPEYVSPIRRVLLRGALGACGNPSLHHRVSPRLLFGFG